MLHSLQICHYIYFSFLPSFSHQVVQMFLFYQVL
nr:MAG TPA: hypothetical protein [Caudoviricetes sp.]DAW93916.1 MAG TPA: hypothetical protein [Caudoviricetes sp.]